MVNRGVMAQPYWWDEQWTISVQHTEADIDKHLAAFDDIAPRWRKRSRNAQRTRSGGSSTLESPLVSGTRRLAVLERWNVRRRSALTAIH